MAIDFTKYKELRKKAEQRDSADQRQASARLVQAEATVLAALIDAEAQLASRGIMLSKITEYDSKD